MFQLVRALAVPLLGLLIPGTALAAGFGLAPDAALPTVGVAGIALVTWRAERRREVRRRRPELQAETPKARYVMHE